ncbi:MAG: BTAD domain-containing putative transcriptional regulator [Thermodesulfobacteriota bacterium]|nr:BTAD domain-containing putative transcriptional regulator [Thermodesulfobacteriota bacterium]
MKCTPTNKITPPSLPKVVPRNRLFNLLDQRQHYQVTWISSMAGSGKTTLAASYLNSRNLPYLWYQIDEGDGDISTFFYYLGLAARKATPRKRKPLPLLTPEYFAGVSVFSGRFFENLCERLTPPFYIVFDNYHKLPLASLFHDVFREGVSRVSPDIHVMILSRTDPPPALTGLVANNMMRIISPDSLRLNLDESKSIVEIESGRRISKERIERIHEKTQGWAAGLILMAKGIKAGDNLSEGFAQSSPEGIFDYFTGELFDKMDETYRDFLLKTALSPKMTALTAKALTGRADAESILSSLRHNHLFIDKFSASAEIYQYHPLFREFLILRGKKKFDRKEMLQLQQKTAELLEASDQIEDAVELYFETNDMAGLIRLIQKQASVLITQGRNKTLEQWIKRIPEEILNKNPWLLYWLGVSCQHFSSAEARGYFERAFQIFNDRKDMAGLFLSWSGAVDSIVYEWNYFTTLDQWIAWFDDHIPLNQAFPSPEIEARATLSMMCALLIRRPQHPDMIKWVERALTLSRRGSDINLYIQASNWAITYYAWTGNFAQAEIIREETRELARSYKTYPPLMLYWKWLDISTRISAGTSIDSALKEVSDALVMVNKTGVLIWTHLFLFVGTMVSLMQGNSLAADDFIKRFEVVLDTSHFHEYAVFHHFAGLHSLLIGNHSQALAHAKKAVQVARETGYVFPEIICRFALAHVLREQEEFHEAQKELARVHNLALATKSRMFEFMCLTAQAQTALDQKREEEGLNLLGKAMSLGRKQGYMSMVWWWNPAIMAKLCAKALMAGIEVEYVQRLMRVHKLVLEDAPHHIEDWPWALELHTFDQFKIIKDGKPLSFTGKSQKKPLELLKVLITYGGIEVGEEQVIDALWYESDGDMAHSAFSTTLNRLRNLIGIKEAILLQAGKVTLDQRYCWVDVWAFERVLNEAEALWKKGEKKQAISLYERAIVMYKGHFLAEGSEEPWMIPMRERLKSKFLGAITKLGKYHEQEEAFEKAIECYEKGLAVDNLEETLYQRIMLCYQNLGRHAEAAKGYHHCRHTLATVLGVDPSEETEAIYKKIRK